jgi:hypothetical protein
MRQAGPSALEGQGREGYAQIATGRAQDISFILDRLTRARRSCCSAARPCPRGTDRTWDCAWRRRDGWKRWLTVTGVGHLDFSDTAVLADQAGPPDTGSPLPGDRTARIVGDYVTAFFDRHLRGAPRPLLDGPTPHNAEVVFHP